MAYKLGSDGKWTHIPETGGGSGGAGGNTGTKIDNGNVSDTSDAISETTANSESKIEYSETATAKLQGDTRARRGKWLNVKKGVASRWMGKWLILACTHTIDQKGYNTDLNLGRKPSSGSGSSSSSSGSSSTTSSSTPASEKTATKTTSSSPAASTSDKVWKLNPNGTWTQTAK